MVHNSGEENMYIAFNETKNTILSENTFGEKDSQPLDGKVIPPFSPKIFKTINVFERFRLWLHGYKPIKLVMSGVPTYHSVYLDYIWVYSINSGLVHKVFKADSLNRHPDSNILHKDDTITIKFDSDYRIKKADSFQEIHF